MTEGYVLVKTEDYGYDGSQVHILGLFSSPEKAIEACPETRFTYSWRSPYTKKRVMYTKTGKETNRLDRAVIIDYVDDPDVKRTAQAIVFHKHHSVYYTIEPFTVDELVTDDG